jgi:hypothetical protein
MLTDVLILNSCVGYRPTGYAKGIVRQRTESEGDLQHCVIPVIRTTVDLKPMPVNVLVVIVVYDIMPRLNLEGDSEAQ